MMKQCFILCVTHLVILAATHPSYSQESAGLIQSISTSYIYSMALSHTGSKIAVSSGSTKIMDVMSKDVIAEIPGIYFIMDFSPDDQQLLLADLDTIDVYDTTTWRLLYSISSEQYNLHITDLSDIHFIAEGKSILTIPSSRGSIGLFDAKTGEPIFQYDTDVYRTYDVAVTTDLQDMILMYRYHTDVISRISISSGKIIKDLLFERAYFSKHHNFYTHQIKILPDKNLLIMAGASYTSPNSNEVLLFDYEAQAEINRYSTPSFDRFYGMVVSPNTQRLMLNNLRDTIFVTDNNIGEVTHQFSFDGHSIYFPICFSGDSSKIAFSIEPNANPPSANTVTPSTGVVSATIYIYDITAKTGVKEWTIY